MDKSIGKNIKRMRQAKGVTQDKMAEDLHVTRQAVSSWETGRTSPDYEMLKRICEYFCCEINDVLNGEKFEDDGKVIYIANNNNNSGAAGKAGKAGITFGSCLAIVISYTAWGSIPWAIFHGLMSWFYVIYYIAKY